MGKITTRALYTQMNTCRLGVTVIADFLLWCQWTHFYVPTLYMYQEFTKSLPFIKDPSYIELTVDNLYIDIVIHFHKIKQLLNASMHCRHNEKGMLLYFYILGHG